MLNDGTTYGADPSRSLAKKNVIDSFQNDEKLKGFGSELPSAAELLDLIPSIVWSARPDGVVDYVNRVWYRISGCSEASEWMQSIHPDDFDKTKTLFEGHFKSGEAFEVQHRMRFADGSYHWMLGRARPLRDELGTVVRWLGVCTDIEEKRTTSEKLEESELLFKLASRATRNVIWDHNVITQKTSYNDALTSELGYELSPEVCDKSWWLDHVHPDDRRSLLEEISHCVENGMETITGEYRFRKADGSYGVFVDRCSFVYDDQKNLQRMIGAMEDVTAERQAAQALKQSEQLWRSLTNTMSQIAWMSDAEGKMQWFNDRYYEFTGMDEASALGFGWKSIVHPDYRRMVDESIRDVLSSGASWDETFPALGKNGEYRWFLSNAHPIRDDRGMIVRWLGTNTDITRQLQLTDRIKEREEQLRMATEAAKLGTWTFDLSTREGYWNEQAALIHGQAGKNHFTLEDFIALAHPDDRARMRAEAERIFTEPVPYTSENEYRVIRPDGGIRWINIVAKKLEQLNPRHGYRIFVVGTIMDLTDRMNAQVELKKAKEAAEAANAAKSAFLANMSHEIRTPLGAILGFANLLKEEHYSPEDRSGFIETIRRAGNSLSRIIDDILDLSKIEAGHIKLEYTSFSLRDLVAESLSLYSEIARTKGISLSFKAGPEAPDMICSDATRIRQILINLIGNAVKFTKEGKVEIELSFDDSSRSFTCAMPLTSGIRIDVKDTGIGIPPMHHERIFRPFTQVDDSTTRNYGGTGLGLALSKRLASALGGDISIDSEESSAGCTFSLVFSAALPQESDEDRDGGAAADVDFIDLEGIEVLVAEDSPEIQFLLGAILKEAGARFELVNNGHEAIQKAMERTFDVILMDIQMPVIDGYEATRAIRAGGFNNSIIAVTAHAMAEERERTRTAGCDHHLTKPLNPAELLRTIQKSVQAQRLS